MGKAEEGCLGAATCSLRLTCRRDARWLQSRIAPAASGNIFASHARWGNLPRCACYA